MISEDTPRQSQEQQPSSPARKATLANESASLLIPEESSDDLRTSNSQSTATFRHLLVSLFFFGLAVALTVPIRPQLILDAANNDASAASFFSGVVQSLQSLLGIVSAPLFGAASDVIGRKILLILSHAGEFIGLFLISQFPTSLVMQAPAYIIIALTTVYESIVNAIIVDISPDSSAQTSVNFGYVGGVFGSAFMIGPMIGAAIESRFFLASSLLAACFLVLCSMVYIMIFVPETRWFRTSNIREERASSSTLQQVWSSMRQTGVNPFPPVIQLLEESTALQWLCFSQCVARLATYGLLSILYLYLNVKLGWETKEYGYFLSATGFSAMLSLLVLVKPMLWMFGERNAVLVCAAFHVLSYLAYALAQRSWHVIVGLGLSSLGYVSDSVMKGVMCRQVSVERQGTLQGGLSGLLESVGVVAPLLASLLFSVGNWTGHVALPMFVYSGLLTVSWWCAWFALRHPSLK